MAVKPSKSTATREKDSEASTSRNMNMTSTEDWEAATVGVTFPPRIKIPALITRDFLSSESDTEEISAGELAYKIMKDLELSDSEEEENSKTVKKIEVEMGDAKTTIEKEVQEIIQPESEIMETEEVLLDQKIAEEQAIKELESELQKVKSNTELTCGGFALSMPWRLIPVSEISIPTGRREWLDTITQERKTELKSHPSDPRTKLRCRKCGTRFVSTSYCIRNGCSKTKNS